MPLRESPQTILDGIVREFLLHCKSVEEINSGLCADFADTASRLIKDAVICDDEETGFYSHTFLSIDGKFYDAETTQGVDNWRDFPIYQRQKKEVSQNPRLLKMYPQLSWLLSN